MRPAASDAERFARAQALFERALHRPLAERDQWLAVAAAGDAALLARVRAMLRADAADDGVLDRDVVTLLTRLEEDAPPWLAPGSRVGPHEVTGVIAEGGTSVVYRARDGRDGRQGGDLALKVFRTVQAGPTVVERCRREIQIGAALRHPNVLPMLDAGEDGGRLWLATPYVPGESLRRRLEREGPLPVATALAVAEQVAAALAHAHGRGVIHRDVKPPNILLAPDGRVLLADFGIARLLDAEPLTAAGYLVGTPGYMSPEQAVGAAVTPATDVYGLACVLHEMLVGWPPFAEPGASPQRALRRAVRETPPSVRAVRADVSPALDALLAAALDPDPARRWADGRAVQAALEAVREGEVPQPRRGWAARLRRLFGR